MLMSASEIKKVDDEDCSEIVSNDQSSLSSAKDTAAAATTDNTPATLKLQPVLPNQQEDTNMIQKSSKHIIFDSSLKSNNGSAQKPL